MKIEHHERGRFIVTDQAGDHLVDALANDGFGQCDCWAFIRKGGIRDQLEDRRSGAEFALLSECPHITAANKALLDMFKKQLIKRFPDTNQTA